MATLAAGVIVSLLPAAGKLCFEYLSKKIKGDHTQETFQNLRIALENLIQKLCSAAGQLIDKLSFCTLFLILAWKGESIGKSIFYGLFAAAIMRLIGNKLLNQETHTQQTPAHEPGANPIRGATPIPRDMRIDMTRGTISPATRLRIPTDGTATDVTLNAALIGDFCDIQIACTGKFMLLNNFEAESTITVLEAGEVYIDGTIGRIFGYRGGVININLCRGNISINGNIDGCRVVSVTECKGDITLTGKIDCHSTLIIDSCGRNIHLGDKIDCRSILNIRSCAGNVAITGKIDHGSRVTVGGAANVTVGGKIDCLAYWGWRSTLNVVCSGALIIKGKIHGNGKLMAKCHYFSTPEVGGNAIIDVVCMDYLIRSTSYFLWSGSHKVVCQGQDMGLKLRPNINHRIY